MKQNNKQKLTFFTWNEHFRAQRSFSVAEGLHGDALEAFASRTLGPVGVGELAHDRFCVTNTCYLLLLLLLLQVTATVVAVVVVVVVAVAVVVESTLTRVGIEQLLEITFT